MEICREKINALSVFQWGNLQKNYLNDLYYKSDKKTETIYGVQIDDFRIKFAECFTINDYFYTLTIIL